jgi:hypothetical protein
MVLLVVYEILTDVSLNSLVLNFVCLPIYVNLAHVVLLLFGFVLVVGLLNCFMIGVSYLLFVSMCSVFNGVKFCLFVVVTQVVGVHSIQ